MTTDQEARLLAASGNLTLFAKTRHRADLELLARKSLIILGLVTYRLTPLGEELARELRTRLSLD